MPYDNYPSETGQGLAITQIVLASLTLIAGIVHAVLADGVWIIGPCLYFISHLACGIVGLYAAKEKTENLIYTNIALNIVIVILFSFNQLFYGIALSVTFGILNDFTYLYDYVESLTAMAVLICLMGLAQVIVTIWSSSLGCCCSQPSYTTPTNVIAPYGGVMYTAQAPGQIIVTAPPAYGHQGIAHPVAPPSYGNPGMAPAFYGQPQYNTAQGFGHQQPNYNPGPSLPPPPAAAASDSNGSASQPMPPHTTHPKP